VRCGGGLGHRPNFHRISTEFHPRKIGLAEPSLHRSTSFRVLLVGKEQQQRHCEDQAAAADAAELKHKANAAQQLKADDKDEEARLSNEFMQMPDAVAMLHAIRDERRDHVKNLRASRTGPTATEAKEVLPVTPNV
jgi:2,3-bisphosphoglycerate-independent phosphoglycerate mutase